MQLAEDRFQSMDVQRLGQMATKQVGNVLTSGLLPPAASDAAVSEAQRQLVAIAEAQIRDIPAVEVQVESVEVVKRDAFVAAAVQVAAIREHVKMSLLTPPRADNDMSEAEVISRLGEGRLDDELEQ